MNYDSIMRLIANKNYEKLHEMADKYFAEKRHNEELDRIKREKYLKRFNVLVNGSLERKTYWYGESSEYDDTEPYQNLLVIVDKTLDHEGEYYNISEICDHRIDHEFEEFRVHKDNITVLDNDI